MVKTKILFDKPTFIESGYLLRRGTAILGYADTLVMAKKKAKAKIGKRGRPINIIKYQEKGSIFVFK